MSYSQKEVHQAEVFVSEVLESRRIPDIYSWRINKYGKLVPEKDETPIEDIIVTDNPVAATEWQAFQKIQNKVPLMEDGDYFLWISLTHPVYYPDTSKIIISQKSGETIVNTSINTDWDVIGGILAAQEFATLSNLDKNTFKSANDVRGNPIFINKCHEEKLGRALQKLLDQRSIEMMTNGQAVEAKTIYVNDYLARKNVSYGNNPLSCPVRMGEMSAFKVFSGEKKGKYVKKCPFCDVKVEKFLKPGYVCSGNPETGKKCGKVFEGVC